MSCNGHQQIFQDVRRRKWELRIIHPIWAQKKTFKSSFNRVIDIEGNLKYVEELI